MSEKLTLISLSEACSYLSISTATGRNWIKSGILIPHDNTGKTFIKEHIVKIKEGIEDNKIDRLNKRRNKKNVKGSFIPKKYINSVKGVKLVEGILSQVSETLDDTIVKIILAEYALKFYFYRHEKNVLDNIYLTRLVDKSHQSPVFDLTRSFFNENNISIETVKEYLNVPNNGLSFDVFDLTDDVLGMLYMSLKTTSSRKKNGIYYTPTKVVKEMIKEILSEKKTFNNIVDPCCGTGNFLIEFIKNGIKIQDIFGYDIDSTSIYIARMNIAIFSNSDEKELVTITNNVCLKDSLSLVDSDMKFDLVVGNPPWGSEFDEKTLEFVSTNYSTFSKRGLEAFSLFIELGCRITDLNGVFSYVVPETFFNVKTHSAIRELVMENMNIKQVTYWGNVFDGVLAPAVSFVFRKEETSKFGLNASIKDSKGNTHKIQKERIITSNDWNFNISDEQLYILNKVRNNEGVVYLDNNADFALGIVTGDNKKHLVNTKINDEFSPIVRGSDVYRFSLGEASNFIKYEPEKYQQVAKNNLYFCEEKLIYRFICDTLVFAYDNELTLSLNSANIIVPKVTGLSIKYIMAILNSKLAHFYFKLSFNSIKILRNHIESIPLKYTSTEVMDEVISIVDKIMETSVNTEKETLYNKLNLLIYDIYDLDSEEKEIIEKFYDRSLFLY